jgi:hypothetical protein
MSKRIFTAGFPDEPQIIKGAMGETAAAFGIHSDSGARPFFGGTGFDLDEDEAIGISKNQVNFTARRTEIGGEKFEARCFEKLLSRPFAEATMPQMGGRRFGGQTVL